MFFFFLQELFSMPPSTLLKQYFLKESSSIVSKLLTPTLQLLMLKLSCSYQKMSINSFLDNTEESYFPLNSLPTTCLLNHWDVVALLSHHQERHMPQLNLFTKRQLKVHLDHQLDNSNSKLYINFRNVKDV